MGACDTSFRVLIVDDEALMRWAMVETLVDAGFTVTDAGSARETLRQLKDAELPDLVLLDFQLPDSIDLELLASIRREAPASAVIMATAYGTPEVQRGAERLGAVRVMDKPLDMTTLPDLVRTVQRARELPA